MEERVILSCKGLRRQFGELPVLRGVDLEVKSGEIVSVVGPSGAGKSTLLYILGTLDRPDAGTLLLDNTEVFSLADKQLSKFRNSKIGFIFQFHNLLPEFTALENICLPALIAGKIDAATTQKAMKLLNMLSLAHRAEHKPSELSGGEQQRVAVARALINDPLIIFADEPSGNLDSKNADELHRLFFELRRELGQTVIYVTHNNAFADMADRKLTMVDGNII